MAVTRNQPIAKAPRESRVRLGIQLFRRREELGFGDSRPRFYRATGVNRRYADDLENARRSNFDEPFLRMAARGYAVTYESLVGVAWGKADELTPAAQPGGETPPFTPERAAADRPWFDPINERRVELASRGIAYPTGAQMFGEGTEDAEAWDGEFAPLPVGDKVWGIADLRRRAAGRAGRAGNSGTGAAGA